MNALAPNPRLLAINNYFYRRGGAEAVFLDHIAMFEQAGWTVAPFAMQSDQNPPSDWSEYFVSEIEFGHQPGLATKLRHAAQIIYSREAQRNIGALVERFRPHLAHAHNVYHHLSPAIFQTLKSHGVPTVMTAHDLKLACPAYKMLSHGSVCEKCKSGNIAQVLLNRCAKDSVALSGLLLLETAVHRSLGLYRNYLDRIVVPSRFYRAKLIEWGWPEEQLVYVPNFVDPNFVASDPVAEGDYYLFAGRLAPEKGIATLIEAAALTGLRLVVAGGGPDEAMLKKLAADRQAPVEFVGYVSGPQLHGLIGGAKALVLPSEWYENAPVSILEAYGLGRPVIGTDIGGIPELIRAEETGLIARPSDAQHLAETLSRMESVGAGRRAAMGAAGRDWVSVDFSAAAYRERMTSLYGQLVPA
ncbi:glycosyltransferase family 4 protein [Devosia sp. 2618]|uniref:glycosyltransferase family 4 protein n=1 Tax=Devosia sp. 2618 TaxID=3156454 RepID=UPI00339375D7